MLWALVNRTQTVRRFTRMHPTPTLPSQTTCHRYHLLEFREPPPRFPSGHGNIVRQRRLFKSCPVDGRTCCHVSCTMEAISPRLRHPHVPSMANLSPQQFIQKRHRCPIPRFLPPNPCTLPRGPLVAALEVSMSKTTEVPPWATVLNHITGKTQRWHPEQELAMAHSEPAETRLRPSGERKKSFWHYVQEHGICFIHKFLVYHGQTSSALFKTVQLYFMPSDSDGSPLSYPSVVSTAT